MTRWLSLLTLALVALSACGSPLAQPGGPVTIIDYVDTVRVGNVRYLVARPSGPALAAADLGDEVTRVRFQIAGSDKGPDYLIQDGDATMLPVGTPLHTVKGYRPGFRLAAQLADGGIRLYECDDNLEAKTGADLLDVAGKTTAIAINSETDGTTPLGRIADQTLAARLAAALETAPVQAGIEPAGARYFVVFQLQDGTSVSRVYWSETGLLGRGIQAPAEFRSAVAAALKS